MKRLLLVCVIGWLVVVPLTAAQDDGGMDDGGCFELTFLTEEFLLHYHEADSPLFTRDLDGYRLNLLFEHMSFLLMCKEPRPCDTLQEYYAEAIAEAETLDDLTVINANFTVDLILCQEADPLDDLPTPPPAD
jgi:hypothetical protein